MEILDMILDIDDGDYWKRIWRETPEEIEKIWDDTLAEVREFVTAYYKAIADREDDPDQYLNLVLPRYWQIVRALNISRWGVDSLPSDSCYDVGIFSVGFSSLPIALSIAEIQPRQNIYFLHSDDTRAHEKCDEIIDRVEEMFETPPHPFCPLINPDDAANLITRVRGAERREIGDPSDPVSIFQEIKDIIDSVRVDLGNGTRIALDLTGGKKTMIGGGFTAGSIYSVAPKCDMFYVDSLEYNSRIGTPKPGTEFLMQLENPYDVYNVQSVAQAKELFKRHNYEGAEQLWNSARKNLDRHATQYHFLEDERKESRDYYGGSHCYYSWDALDYETAVKHKTYRVNGTVHDWGYDIQHVDCTVDRTIDALNILAEVQDKHTLFDKQQRVIHYAVDRYQNGMRRKQVFKFEDALVRFTQVIEILCNYRIYQLAQDNHLLQIGSDKPMPPTPPDHPWDLKPLIRMLFGAGSVKVQGKDCYVSPDKQMDVRNYDYGPVGEMTDIIQPRNDFIHFNNPMKQEKVKSDVENLRQLALDFLTKFSEGYRCENGLDFNGLLELHKFRR